VKFVELNYIAGFREACSLHSSQLYVKELICLTCSTIQEAAAAMLIAKHKASSASTPVSHPAASEEPQPRSHQRSICSILGCLSGRRFAFLLSRFNKALCDLPATASAPVPTSIHTLPVIKAFVMWVLAPGHSPVSQQSSVAVRKKELHHGLMRSSGNMSTQRAGAVNTIKTRISSYLLIPGGSGSNSGWASPSPVGPANVLRV